MKRALVSVVIMACGLSLVGCGGSKTASEESYNLPKAKISVSKDTPSWKKDKEKANLTWYVNFDWFAQKWGKDYATKFITEDTNVSITYQAGTSENLNTKMASGDLPDIVTLDSQDPLVKDAAKWALPLDVLSKKYDPYFYNGASKEEVTKYYTTKDGHLYGYPNYATTKADYEKGGLYGNEAFLVRKDIYEQIGKPDMSTPEGFIAALKKVQELGLKDDSGKPIVPLGTWPLLTPDDNRIFSGMLADMIGVPLTKNDKQYDRFMDKDFQKWFSTLSQARRDGLTDRDMVTMNDDNNNAQVINGSYFAYFQPNIIGDTDPMSQRSLKSPDASYIAVNGPASTIGRKTIVQGPSLEGWTLTFISKKVKNPEKAMELITYLTSPEGDNVMNFGREGKTFKMVDGKPVLNEDLLTLKQTDPAKYETEIGLGTHPWVTDSALLSRQMGVSQFPAALMQQKEWTMDHLVFPGKITNLDAMLSKESGRNLNKINQNWSQTVAKILNAKSDSEVANYFKDFNSYRESTGWKQITDERNKQIEYNIEKGQ
ncbi:extracellular solute-binding protein [Neobacillus drentensis]|uniref:ABC transporter substrate-binding protein n=1 Tax=Neobacillus drentensis TaxID=220684 RepID=UPI002FFEE99E